MNNNQQRGLEGEDLAASYLQSHGYKIIQRNWRSRYGELDIIAMDQDVLCFVEVKTRDSEDFSHPLEAITKFKQRQMTRTALSYLQEENKNDAHSRFDVVTVDLSKPDFERVELLKNAFEVES